MTDRKQEKTRRIWGSNLMRDLQITSGSHILTSPEHIKQFQAMTRETNFIFRAEMAESLGNMMYFNDLQQWAIKKDEFQEFYMDELIDLINDSDNMVRLKAFQSVAKLVAGESYIKREQMTNDIIPVFIKLTETILEDEDGL